MEIYMRVFLIWCTVHHSYSPVSNVVMGAIVVLHWVHARIAQDNAINQASYIPVKGYQSIDQSRLREVGIRE